MLIAGGAPVLVLPLEVALTSYFSLVSFKKAASLP